MEIDAAVAHANHEVLALEKVDLAAPQGSEVRVRLVASGICGTDLSVLDHVPLPWPAVLGHEGAGIVEEVGPAVVALKPGDHVVLSTASCGRCESCQIGQPSFCTNFVALNMAGGQRADGSRIMHQHGKPVFSGFLGQSSFAAHVIAEERNAIKVDSDLPLDVLAPFGCGIQTGAGAVLNTLDAKAGRSIAIFGAGAVGLSALMAARIAGCDPVIVVDTNADRLALAKELGATQLIDAREANALEVIEAHGGVDYTVEATGVPSVMEDAVNALRVDGRAVLVGIANGQKIALDPMILQNRGLTVRGMVMAGHHAVPALFVTRLIGFWKAGKLPVEKLIRFYDFERINDAVNDIRNGSAVKPIVLFGNGNGK